MVLRISNREGTTFEKNLLGENVVRISGDGSD